MSIAPSPMPNKWWATAARERSLGHLHLGQCTERGPGGGGRQGDGHDGAGDDRPGRGLLQTYCDVCLTVPERETFRVQELHLPIYHALGIALEEALRLGARLALCWAMVTGTVLVSTGGTMTSLILAAGYATRMYP